MVDFLVTIFTNNSIVTRQLSKLTVQCHNNVLQEELFDGLEVEFPFYMVNGSYQLDTKATLSNMKAFVNNEESSQHNIDHGDYVNFNNQDNEMVYSLLFVETSKISMGYKKFKMEKDSTIFIGRTLVNDISFTINGYISREKHAAINVDSQGVAYIEDLKRSTGVFLNGRRINSSKLSLYDEIYIMGLSMVYMGEYVAVRNNDMTCRLEEYQDISVKELISIKNEKDKHFVRTTRILRSLDSGAFEIDPPTSSQRAKRLPIILTMGPSLTMSIAMLVSMGFSIANLTTGGSIQSTVTSGAMAISMFMGALLWPALMNSYQRRHEEAEEKYRRDKYNQYIAEKDKELSAKYERNTRIWNEALAPSPDFLCELLSSDEKKLRLWERSVTDSDFLNVRVGRGNRDFGIDIMIPKSGFTLDEDQLLKLPQAIAAKYSVLRDVPIVLDLKEQKTIGFIGKATNIENIANGIILNIVALHAYDEVKIIVICKDIQLKRFDWMKEIPHVWSTDRSVRYIATNTIETHQICNSIDEIVKERDIEENRKNKTQLPYFIFFITDPSLVENEPLLRYIEDPQNQVGISGLFLYGDISRLPKACSTILQSDNLKNGYYSKNKNNNKFVTFESDIVNMQNVIQFAEKLSNLPVKIDVKNLSVPNRVSFLQMYKTGNVAGLGIEQHWNNNVSNKTLAAPIGIMAGGEVFSLDIHEAYHGCHGLVAGMTGSGKSEFLQAYILSLAINYSPNEVAFVLVDFKGGDMARPFMAKHNAPAIPHLSATISNLSGNILYRALVSFEAEIKTRQRIFNETAAILGFDKLDINSYHRYFKEGKLKTPLPHLIIVIDEFAQLKTQQPEFLTQLINVAQVGRSLGIHLILATQKPSGVVDPQIWSNSRFRVCLKVLDKQDSMEMINRPDAAMIKLPGRCYVQVGYDEVFECLQSGFSGADYIPTNTYLPDEDITLHLVDHTATPVRSAKDIVYGKKTDKTQLEAIISNVVSIGVEKNLRVKPLWCELLKEKILLDEIIDSEALQSNRPSLAVPIGLVDYVKTQQQHPLKIDFLNSGHIAMYGAAGTGKTTFIQTLICSLVNRYTPEEFNLYALDFGGRAFSYLNMLPHTGGVVFSDNEVGVVEVLDTIQTIIDERKVLFESCNCSSYIEYLSATGRKLPAILLIIDNYTPFREKFYHLEDDVVNIISSGKAYGINAVLTGNSRNAIYYKVCEHISAFYTLRMNDSMNYRDILNVTVPIEPENIKGRGITVIDGNVVEFQIALAVDGENEAERVNAICRSFSKYADAWSGFRPVKLGSNTTTAVNAAGASQKKAPKTDGVQRSRSNPPDPIENSPHTLVVGNSVSGALKYGIELMNTYSVFVGGKSKSEIYQYLTFLLKSLDECSNRQLIFIDKEEAFFKNICDKMHNSIYISSSGTFSSWIKELEETVASRKTRYEELSAANLVEDIIYGNMFSFDRKFIVISDFKDFYDMIYDEDADKFTRIIKTCSRLGIYFITAANLEDISDYNQVEMYLYLVKSKHGIIVGGIIDVKAAGLLCDEMIEIALSHKPITHDNQCLFYSNSNSVPVIF